MSACLCGAKQEKGDDFFFVSDHVVQCLMRACLCGAKQEKGDDVFFVSDVSADMSCFS